jgi:hypothetical protein
MILFYLGCTTELIIGVSCTIRNIPENLADGDITCHVVKTCQDAVVRNGQKKFVFPTFPESEIPIPGEWQLATSFDAKRGPTWLDKGEKFESVKELLEFFFSDNKKSSSYTVWLGFRAEDTSDFSVRQATIVNSTPAAPVKPKIIKSEPDRRAIKAEKAAIKQEPPGSTRNVRCIPVPLKIKNGFNVG